MAVTGVAAPGAGEIIQRLYLAVGKDLSVSGITDKKQIFADRQFVHYLAADTGNHMLGEIGIACGVLFCFIGSKLIAHAAGLVAERIDNLLRTVFCQQRDSKTAGCFNSAARIMFCIDRNNELGR